MSLFSDSRPVHDADDRIDEAREALLALLHGSDKGEALSAVVRKLTWAPDAQSLWYLRSEVMSLLSGELGETEAVHRVKSVSPKFKGLVPASQISPTSRLGRK